jgi:hypothetical protein
MDAFVAIKKERRNALSTTPRRAEQRGNFSPMYRIFCTASFSVST